MPHAEFCVRTPSFRRSYAFLQFLLALGAVGSISQGHAQTGPLSASQTPATDQTGPLSASQTPAAEMPPTTGGAVPIFTAGIELSETYGSNALGVARSSSLQSDPDFITSLRLNLGLHHRTARFQGDIAYSLAGYLYAQRSSLNRVSNYLNGIGRAVLVPEHVLLDVRAFAAPILVSRLGPLSAEDRPIATGNTSGRRDTYGYTIAPDFLFRLGSFATSETTFSQGSVFFFHPGGPRVDGTIPGEAPPVQATTYGVTERFSSGSDFNRIAWSLIGTANKSTRISGDLEEAAGAADFRYALTREISLLATGGYASITTSQALTHSLVGPVALGGLAIDLGPAFRAEMRAGWQFNYSSYTGSLHYELGPSTTLSGSLSDRISTPALSLITRLGQLDANAQGNFFDTDYQLDVGRPPDFVSEISAFDPAPMNQFGLGIGGGGGAQISRYRSGTLSLLHESERTRYRLTVHRLIRDGLTVLPSGVPPGENSTGVTALISHDLTRVLTGAADAGYSIHDVLGGQNTIFRTRAELTFLMTPVMTSYLRAAYLHRLSDRALVAVSPESGNLSDASITIGIRRQLF